MSKHPSIVSRHRANHGSFLSYSVAFMSSLVLTYVAFGLVMYEVITGWTLALTLAFLAVIQLVIQLVFFLHLGKEPKPRWNAMVLSFMLVIVVIIVGGTLWIINNLQYRHGHEHSPKDNETYIIKDEGFKK